MPFTKNSKNAGKLYLLNPKTKKGEWSNLDGYYRDKKTHQWIHTKTGKALRLGSSEKLKENYEMVSFKKFYYNTFYGEQT